MPRFSSTRRVRHPPQAMFELVADVERYPAFVPMCEALVVRRRVRGDEGLETLLADMTIGYKVIRETFTTRVRLDRPRLLIDVEYVDGPFSHLDNRWRFSPAPDGGCVICFEIDYAFRSRAFQMLAGAVFETVYRRMVQSFEERADSLYGLGAGAS